MSDEKSPAALSAENLQLERGERLLFARLSFTARAGTVTRLAGANGTGKTSLLTLMTGLMRPDEGVIRYCGEDILKLREEYYRDLVYIGHKNGVKDDLTVVENLRIAAGMGHLALTDEDIARALEGVQLTAFAGHLAGELSQGQRRRASLARLFVSQQKPVWILDEPFVALDVKSVENLTQAIAGHVMAGGIVIYTTHQDSAVPVPEDRKQTVDVSAFAPRYMAGEDGHV